MNTKFILLSSLLLAGCCGEPVVLKPDVVMPMKPVLPTLPKEALDCLSDPAYGTLVERDLLLKDYAEKCEVILQKVIEAEPIKPKQEPRLWQLPTTLQ